MTSGMVHATGKCNLIQSIVLLNCANIINTVGFFCNLNSILLLDFKYGNICQHTITCIMLISSPEGHCP